MRDRGIPQSPSIQAPFHSSHARSAGSSGDGAYCRVFGRQEIHDKVPTKLTAESDNGEAPRTTSLRGGQVLGQKMRTDGDANFSVVLEGLTRMARLVDSLIT